MVTIKSFTSLEQSKKLAEILPLESSDGYWDFQIDGYKLIADELGYYKNDSEIPCWSLAALLNVLPEGTRLLKSTNISSVGDIKYHCDCPKVIIDEWFDNPIDACVSMIEKLNELKML